MKTTKKFIGRIREGRGFRIDPAGKEDEMIQIPCRVWKPGLRHNPLAVGRLSIAAKFIQSHICRVWKPGLRHNSLVVGRLSIAAKFTRSQICRVWKPGLRRNPLVVGRLSIAAKFTRSQICRVWKPGLLVLLMLTVSGCDAVAPLPAQAVIPLTGKKAEKVRSCDFVPGVSIPAQMPANLVATYLQGPDPKTYPFAINQVEAAITRQQLQVFSQIWEAIQMNSLTQDLTGKSVNAIRQKYEALIHKGLRQDDFYQAIKQMLVEIDGGLSRLWKPSEVAKYSGVNAGIGVAGSPAVVDGRPAFIVLWVDPNSPASLAGLKNRDVILTVDGEAVVDEYGQPRIYGPLDEGLTITVKSPGGPVVELHLARSPVNRGVDSVDACLVPGTHIGYIHLMGYSDRTAVYQMEEALRAVSAAEPLQGLVLDTRMNTGGDPEILNELLADFTGGKLESYITQGNIRSWNITPRDIAGSQRLPLLILQDETSRPVGDTFVGALQLTGRARTVGSTIPGPFYRYQSFDLPDHSRLFVPSRVFQPAGKPVGYFDRNGIVPDFLVPARWDLFTEATDPVLAKAVEMLLAGWDGTERM